METNDQRTKRENDHNLIDRLEDFKDRLNIKVTSTLSDNELQNSILRFAGNELRFTIKILGYINNDIDQIINMLWTLENQTSWNKKILGSIENQKIPEDWIYSNVYKNKSLE